MLLVLWRTRANLVTFASGWGDGEYTVYLGTDAPCLLVDFDVVRTVCSTDG
jgi:hypothetical protein